MNFKDSISKQHVCISIISSFSLVLSKAFEMSVVRIPLKPPLYENRRHFFINNIKECRALCLFRKLHGTLDIIKNYVNYYKLCMYFVVQ